MKEIVFSNLESLVNEKDNVSRNRSKKTWEAVDYETGKINGVMLVAPQGTSPEEVTISLGLKGWYKIYLGMLSFNYDQTTMYTYFKLDSDKAFSGLYPRPEGRIWHAHETVDEFLWKCAKIM